MMLVPVARIAFVLSTGPGDSGEQPLLYQLFPERVFDVEVSLSLADADGESTMRMYVPVGDERQEVLVEGTLEGPGPAELTNEPSGRLATWKGSSFSDPSKVMMVRHGYRVRLRALRVNLDSLPDEMARVRPTHEVHLASTADIQTSAPDIADRLRAIGALADTLSVLEKVRRVYDDVLALRRAPFKGTTDALTALRLQEASCNGRSRLMVAMLRTLGIPSRLVGGIILENGTKRTSHQWLEAHLGGIWVPFDALNDHFAALPDRYLKLYTGDEPLFRHAIGLPFDYSFSVTSRLVMPAEGLRAHQVWRAFDAAGIPVSLLQFLLLMPIGAVVVALMRNVVGAKTFGLFLPALLAVSMRETGFLIGSVAFVSVIGLVALLHPLLERWRLMYTPRLVILLIAVVSLFLGISALGVFLGQTQFAYITLFPIVIVAITAERLARKWEEWGGRAALATAAQTLLVVGLAYLTMGSLTLETALLAFPELFLVLVGAMLLLGRWTGVRVSELWRFRRVGKSALGMNARNVHGVFAANSPQAIAVANDKIATKTLLAEAGIPVSPQRGVFDSVMSLSGLRAVLDRPVALKPAAGRGGGGILLIQPSPTGGFENIHGEPLPWDLVLQHATEIIHGRFSFGDEDTLLVEDMLVPDPAIAALHGKGVADFRFIFEQGRLLMAMLRLPTKASDGKANLHAGGVGVAVDLATGVLGEVVGQDGVSPVHPDGARVQGKTVPRWADLLGVAERAAAFSPLGFVGVDLVLDQHLGPVVLEWNARPGLEIQNVHAQPLPLAAGRADRFPMPWGIVALGLLLAMGLVLSDQILLNRWAAAETETWIAGNAQSQPSLWQWDEEVDGNEEDASGASSSGDPLVPSAEAEAAASMVALAESAEARGDWLKAEAIWRQIATRSTNPRAWMGVGKSCLRQEEWSKALAAYDAALAMDSLRHGAWVNGGIALSQMQRHASAAERYRKAQSVVPERMSAWLNEGIAWLRAGEPDRALPPLVHAADRTTGALRAKVLTYLAQAQTARNETQAARANFSEAISLNPRTELARLGLAMLAPNPEEQRRLIEQVLRLNPTSAIAHFRMAEAEFAAGRRSEAEFHFERALDLDASNADFKRGLVSFYLSERRWAEAEALVRSDRATDAADAFIAGRIAAEREAWEEAVAKYDTALAASHNEMAEAWLNRGVALRRLDRLEDALASYRWAASKRERYPEAWYNMALSFAELGQSDSAIFAYRRCLDLDSTKANAQYNLGILLGQTGDAPAAIAAWKQAVSLDPAMRKAWFNIGVNLRQLGDNLGAVQAYDSLLARFPNDERAWFNRGIALRAEGRDSQAKASYRAALDADPGYIAAWINLGSLQADAGDYAAAAFSFQEAVERSPGHAEARFNLGLQLRRLDRQDEAVLAFEQSAQLDLNFRRPREQLLELYEVMGAADDRLRIADELLTKAEVETWGGDSIYEYARELHRADLQNQAIPRYELAVSNGKTGEWPLYWRAKAFEELGATADAIAGYDDVLDREPSFKFALYRSSMLLAVTGNRTEAAARWAELENLHPEFAKEKWSDKP